MAMNIGSDAADGEEEAISTINTTPLVDVMLVLLIIFLITVPVVTTTVPVALPDEENQALQTRPENITITVDEDGNLYWELQKLRDTEVLQRMLLDVATQVPQPEIHIRGDRETRYDNVNEVVKACQRASIFKVAFITEPGPRGS